MREQIRAIIEDLITVFAAKDDDGAYWGHDTYLGDCEDEISGAVDDIMDIIIKSHGGKI